MLNELQLGFDRGKTPIDLKTSRYVCQTTCFFLLSATTRVEFWLSQRFSSILGDHGLVPTI